MIGKSRSGRRMTSRTASCCAVVVAVTAIGIAPARAAATPGAPKITSAVAIEQGTTLTFTKPVSDGGARILDYRVTCSSSDGGTTVKRTAAKSPISIAGMSVKRHYTCVVAARNATGVGSPSKPSATIVPKPQNNQQLPDAPAEVDVRADVESVFVTYTKPIYGTLIGRLFINRYRAKCSSSDGGVTHREERSWTIPGIEVQHLTPGKTYHCIVAARNSNGWSAYSALSDAVVPLGAAVKPGAPKITSAIAIVGGIRLGLRAPISNGGAPILGYRIGCTSTNGGGTVVRNLPPRPTYKMVGLSAGKNYTCRLAARNAVGVGPFSAPSPTVVPLAA